MSRLSSASVSIFASAGLASTWWTSCDVRSLSSAERQRLLEVGAREHLGDDALDDAVLSERAADSLGQRAREHEIDRARGLGAASTSTVAVSIRLRAPAPAVCAAEATPADDRLAHRRPRDRARGPQHESPGRNAEPARPHDDPGHDVRLPVGRPLHPGSFTAPARIRKLWTSCHCFVAVSETFYVSDSVRDPGQVAGSAPAPGSPGFGGSSPPMRARKTWYVQAW